MSLVLRVNNGLFRTFAVTALGGAAVWSAGALAQSAPVVSQPVVQALPSQDTQHLNDALARLGRDPRNFDALVDAGDAARGLGDMDAAIGFYRRAGEISPDSPRVKAGLARANVMNGDPISAIKLFDEAAKAGAPSAEIAADRGLAYDLVGDTLAAQRFYAVALAAEDTDEVRMRLAISQAIGGDQEAAEETLMPLLRKRDKPGWRTRAFALAIDGQTKQAVDITETILPPQLAENVAPYLRYMPRLTKAQQAAAANLGRFPRASEIGHDDPRIAAYSPTRVAAADTALVSKGEPLDGNRARKSAKSESKSSRKASRRSETVRKTSLAAADPDRVAPPDPKPAIESTGELPPLRKSADSAPPVAEPARAALPSTPEPAPRPAVVPVPTAPATETPEPGFDLAQLPAGQALQPGAATAPAASAPTPTPQAPAQPSLAEAFANLGKPTAKAAPASGAVDIRSIEPAKPEPKVEEKPKPKKPAPPAHPSRIWVQIGIGRNKDAIAFDWRRYTKQAPELFKGRKAYITDLGRTNRILAGPFESRKAANQFVVDLRKAGIDGALPWVSPAGQVVDVLPVD
ncbi:SPOR domain-containing protein [Novosphingobium malaysiense]|uniref:Sporulation protein SsgA n=1 Tax=Novosphingobium malaysiense TaxID=1348853 RepID=A0A0B1ZHR2_9SPHN|nr:SPOR domain-containing protein [Novosphingobium malaysiense]KHK90597.1 sporulation protein SsgA [Novosphingobium malaysiense]